VNLQAEDYYLLPDGRLVFTEHYHLRRGYCCGSGCKHCPFDYVNVPEPKRSRLKAEKDNRHETDPGG
jgi:hypothetical protein